MPIVGEIAATSEDNEMVLGIEQTSLSDYTRQVFLQTEIKRSSRLVYVLHGNFFAPCGLIVTHGWCTYIFRRNSVTCLPLSDRSGMNFLSQVSFTRNRQSVLFRRLLWSKLPCRLLTFLDRPEHRCSMAAIFYLVCWMRDFFHISFMVGLGIIQSVRWALLEFDLVHRRRRIYWKTLSSS